MSLHLRTSANINQYQPAYCHGLSTKTACCSLSRTTFMTPLVFISPPSSLPLINLPHSIAAITKHLWGGWNLTSDSPVKSRDCVKLYQVMPEVMCHLRQVWFSLILLSILAFHQGHLLGHSVYLKHRTTIAAEPVVWRLLSPHVLAIRTSIIQSPKQSCWQRSSHLSWAWLFFICDFSAMTCKAPCVTFASHCLCCVDCSQQQRRIARWLLSLPILWNVSIKLVETSSGSECSRESRLTTENIWTHNDDICTDALASSHFQSDFQNCQSDRQNNTSALTSLSLNFCVCTDRPGKFVLPHKTFLQLIAFTLFSPSTPLHTLCQWRGTTLLL